jgi:mRNA deadenylase 3'-5' endonuclease subunit Ccr4
MWLNAVYQEYFRKNHQQYFKFHIVCYNILAQILLEENLFLYKNCLNNNLKWYRRKDRLIRELLRQDADILCLQEMQNDHYENVFRSALKEHGTKKKEVLILYSFLRIRINLSKTIR